MLASSILSIFAALSFSVTFAVPLDTKGSDLEVRADTIDSIIAVLQDKVNILSPQITAAAAASTLDSSSLSGMLSELNTDITSATNQVSALTSATDGISRRATESAVASSYASLLTSIANALDPVQALASTSSDISSIFSTLIGSVNGLSAALENLVKGLLDLVGQLLVAVAALLNRLGIDLENF